MSNILVTVNEQSLHITNAPKIAAQGVKENYLVLTFDPTWTGFGKSVLFYREDDDETVYESAVDANGYALVPHEVTDQDGKICFGVCGVKDDIVYTTEILKYKIVKGLYTAGEETAPPTPGIYEQMLSIAGSMQGLYNAIEEDVADLEDDLATYQAGVDRDLATLSAQMDEFIADHAGSQFETVLYVDQAGITSGSDTFTLSDDPENYDYIDVYYAGQGYEPLEIYRFPPEQLTSYTGIYLTYVAAENYNVNDLIPELTVRTINIAPVNTSNHLNYKVKFISKWDWSGGSSNNATNVATGSGAFAGAILKIVGVKLMDDAEVADIRVGADGTTYQTAGAAVRGQIDDLKNAFGNSDNLKRDILPFMQFGNFSVVGGNTIGYSLSTNTQTFGMSSFGYAKNPIVFIKKPEAISAGLTCAVQIFRKQGDKLIDSTSMMSWFNATQVGGTSIEEGVYYWIGFRDGRNPHQLTKDKIADYFEIFEVYNNIGYGQSSSTIAGFTGSAHVSIDIKTEYAETDLRVMSNDWTHMRVTYGLYPSDALFTAAERWEYSKHANFVIPAGTYYRLGIFRVDDSGTAIAQTEYRDLIEMRSAVVVGEADSVAIKFNPLYQNDQIDARGLTTLIANIAKRLAVVEAANDINVIPEYYQTHIADKATAINALRPANGSQFAFITDIHIGGYTSRGGNALNAHALLNYLCQNTIINKVFNGGDLINNNASYTIPNSIQKIRTAIGYAQPDTVANQFYIVGNHDGGLDYDGGGNITSPRHITPKMLAVASGVYSVAMDVIYDPNSPFQFYYDNSTEGIRYIVLDIGERDNATDEGYLNSWRFFADALMSTPDGYHIVVFNHISGYSAATGEIAESYKQYIYDTLDAYKARQSYTLIGTETRNYAGAKGVVACVICGHSHEDFQGYTTGGIPWFVTTTDNAGGQFTNGAIGTGRPTGTTDEQAFDVFTIDKETKTINVTRIGYGADRTATY